MTGATVSVTAMVLLGAVGLVLEVLARRGEHPATVAETLGAAMRTTPGRLTVLVVWVWLGVHFLAR